MRTPAASFTEAQFNHLALELFALQFASNTVYRRVCESSGRVPDLIKHWAEIPPVPTGAFKELELTSIPVADRTCVFHSSGTTRQLPSRHFHCPESLALYETSLWAWFEPHLVNQGTVSMLSLTPLPCAAPNSSLAHMMGVVSAEAGQGRAVFAGVVREDGWQLDLDVALRELTRVSACTEPCLILGTAFQFVELTDHCERLGLSFKLPRGSRVMETGGYKGRTRELPKAELHARIARWLGVEDACIVCEYGMSELSSQAYDRKPEQTKGERVFRFPPWARARVISPETGAEVADGEKGLLRVFDLANVWSVASIQTEDIAIRRGDGFELLGRTTAVEPRGCSLMTI